jgi:glutaredoxin
MRDVVVYGTTWSVATWDIRRLLENINVPFQYVDLDADAEALAWVRTISQGDVSHAIPVVRLPNDALLLSASRREVARFYGIRLDSGLLRPLASDKNLSPSQT